MLVVNNSADFSIAQNIIYSMYKNRLYKYSMADDNWELINSAFPGSSDNSPFSFSDGQYIYAGFGEWYQDGYYGGYWYKDEDIEYKIVLALRWQRKESTCKGELKFMLGDIDIDD